MQKIYVDLNKDSPLRLVSKDIIEIKYSPDKTLNQLNDEFYGIMKKHKIKFTHSSDGGNTFQGSCFEYTICRNLFLEQIKMAFAFAEWGILGFNKIPRSIYK